MTGIADFSTWKQKLASPNQRLETIKVGPATGAGKRGSMWATASLAGAAPSTAAVPASNITGALGQNNAGSAALYLANMTLTVGTTSALNGYFGGYLELWDRLSHQGGLSGTDTSTPQTTNLPTAALTRYTSGVGVFAFLEVYSTIGTTASTVTVDYTDTSGSPQTSPSVVFGGSSYREAGVVIQIPLVSGGNGVQSVTGVTLAGTTGTTGNFGVTLAKPIASIPLSRDMRNVFDPLVSGHGFNEILDDACLYWIVRSGANQYVGLTAISHLIEV